MFNTKLKVEISINKSGEIYSINAWSLGDSGISAQIFSVSHTSMKAISGFVQTHSGESLAKEIVNELKRMNPTEEIN